MNITPKNIAPERPANVFFSDDDCFHRFRRHLLGAQEEIRKARLNCLDNTALFSILLEVGRQLDTLKVEDD